MSYFDFTDLQALIPGTFATEALDDDGDGVAEMFEAVAAAAERAVNAYLEGQYATPLTGTIPNAVKQAAVIECARLCYHRRGREEAFPFAQEHKAYMGLLEEIRQGRHQLTPGRPSVSGKGSVISEPSRTHGSGRLGS